MADSDIVLSAKIQIDKSVDSEFKRINDLSKKAFSTLPSSTKNVLAGLRNNAEQTYRELSKSTGELKQQQDIEKAITAQKAEQNRLSIAQKQKSGIETALIKAQNLGNEGQIAKKQAELDRINGVIHDSEQRIVTLGSTITQLQGEISDLVQQGKLLGNTITFENATVQATNLLSILQQIEGMLSGINLDVTEEEIAEARDILDAWNSSAMEGSWSANADTIQGFLDSGVYEDVTSFRDAVAGLADTVGYVRTALSQPVENSVMEQTETSATDATEEFESMQEQLVGINSDLRDTYGTVTELMSTLATVGETQEGAMRGVTIANIATQASEACGQLEEVREKIEAVRTAMQENKPDLGVEQYQQLEEMLNTVENNFKNILGKVDTLPVAHLGESFDVEELEGFASELERTIALYGQLTTAESQPISDASLTAMRDTLTEVQETIREVKGEPPITGDNVVSSETPAQVSEVQSEVSELEAEIAKLSEKPIDIQLWDNSAKPTGELQQVNNEMEQTSQTANKTRAVFAFLGGAITGAFAGLSGHLKSSDKQINQLASSVSGRLVGAFNKVKGAIEKAFSGRSMKRGLTTLIKYTFGVRSLYFLFRKLRNAVKEGLQNLVQYQSSTNATNKAMTELKTSLLFLKNAWAAAFAPIINYVMPMLTSLIDAMAEVGNAIARFIGALTGQSKVLNAVKVNAGDYAKSLNKVGGSAKKARDRLASFDDLNVLGRDSDSGGGGGAGDYTPDPNEMFEYVDAVSEFADMLKDAWAKADFTEIGATLKDKIVSTLQGINWDEVYTEAGRVGKSAGTFLNGLFGDPQLWKEAGGAIAGGLNTITYAVQAFLEETGKIDFGGNFATLINEILLGTDWLTAGQNINEFFNQLINNVNSFVDTIDTDALSQAIVDFAEGLNLPELALNIFDCAINIVDGVIEIGDALITKFGEKLGEDLVIYVSKDRNIVFEDAGEVITVPYEVDWQNDPMGGLGQSILFDIGQWAVDKMGISVTTENVGELNDKFNDLLETVYAVVEIISGAMFGPFGIPLWLDGLLRLFGDTTLSEQAQIFGEVLSDLGDRIQQDLQPVADWFEDIAEQAGLVFEGISQIGEGLSMFWDSLVEGLKEFDLIGLMEEAGIDVNSIDLDNFWEIGGAVALGILEGIGKALVEIPTWMVENVFTPISNAFCDAFGIHSPSTVFAEYGVDIIQGLLDGMNSMIESVIQIFTDLKDSLAQKWEDIRISASEKWRTIKESITGKVIELKDSVVSKFVEIKDNIIGKILMLKDNAIQKFMEIRAGIYNAFSSLADLIKTPINAVIGVVESFVNKVIKGINKLIGSFDGIGDLASQVGLTVPELKIPEISIPRLAQGAVIPPNKEFMAVLGDQSHGTNIEAPLDTIKQAVADVMGANGNQEVVQLLQQLITVVENKNLTIGDKEIGKANARYTNQQRMIRGTSF